MSDLHTTVQYLLRLPEDLRENIKSLSQKNGRSMNAEIIARLEKTLEQDELLNSSNGFIDIVDGFKNADNEIKQLQSKADKVIDENSPQGVMWFDDLTHSVEELKEIIKSRFPKSE